MGKKGVEKYIHTEVTLVIPESEKAGTIQALDAIKALFGPGGKFWIKGDEHQVHHPGDRFKGKELQKRVDTFCLVGGVKEIDGRCENAARVAIATAISEFTKKELDVEDGVDDGFHGTITDYNDAKSRSWADIKRVLKRARQLVQQA